MKRRFLEDTKKNLYAIEKNIWQCDNDWIPPCKDAAYDFTLSGSQKLTIGKRDPENPAKMICDREADQPELEESEVRELPTPTEDEQPDTEMCQSFVKKWWKDMNKIPEIYGGKDQKVSKKADFTKLQASMDDDNNDAWKLRKCCIATANENGANI